MTYLILGLHGSLAPGPTTGDGFECVPAAAMWRQLAARLRLRAAGDGE